MSQCKVDGTTKAHAKQQPSTIQDRISSEAPQVLLAPHLAGGLLSDAAQAEVWTSHCMSARAQAKRPLGRARDDLTEDVRITTSDTRWKGELIRNQLAGFTKDYLNTRVGRGCERRSDPYVEVSGSTHITNKNATGVRDIQIAPSASCVYSGIPCASRVTVCTQISNPFSRCCCCC